jgi:phosphocarrier protein HPr
MLAAHFIAYLTGLGLTSVHRFPRAQNVPRTNPEQPSSFRSRIFRSESADGNYLHYFYLLGAINALVCQLASGFRFRNRRCLCVSYVIHSFRAAIRRWHSKCLHPLDAGYPINRLSYSMNAVATPKQTEVRRNLPGSQHVTRTFVVNLVHGLHARPCAMLVKVLQPHCVEVNVESNGEQASGKSILGLMALGAGHGSNITFTISGEDALRAMDQLEQLFSSNFESAYLAR